MLRGELDTRFLLKSRRVQENSCNYLIEYLKVFGFARSTAKHFSKLLVNEGTFGVVNLFKYVTTHKTPNSYLTASLNKDMPSYTYQALPAPSRANDNFEVLSCRLEFKFTNEETDYRLQLSQHVAAESQISSELTGCS